ncbi:hypothetical protein [Anaerolentibacter hominis]|uniref:hypothetical protein n=1 Tax=Anaerolentibacter hominis TaxID=3079009 RepID=UPI0031B84862
MNAAFWSNARGRGRTTSNLAALCIMHVLLTKHKSIVMENHCGRHSLESALVGYRYRSAIREQDYYHSQIGLDYLIKTFHTGHIPDKTIEEVSQSMLSGKLCYLPAARTNEDIFDYNLNLVMDSLFPYLEKQGEDIFFDLAEENSMTTKFILERADRIVVNLPQDPEAVEAFLKEHPEETGKIFYLIGDYDRESRYSKAYLSRKFSIPKDQIGIIPHNIHFSDALLSGTVLRFITSGYRCSRDDPNHYFIYEVKRTLRLMEKMKGGDCQRI